MINTVEPVQILGGLSSDVANSLIKIQNWNKMVVMNTLKELVQKV